MTYWNGNGKYEKENKIIWDKYIPSSGIRLTNSDVANKALIAYLRTSQKYYRFYNDGDGFGGMHSFRKAHMGGYHKDYPHDEFNERIAEEAVDKSIRRVWSVTNGATLPVVDEIEDKDDYDVYSGRGRITYESSGRGKYGSRRFSKVLLD